MSTLRDKYLETIQENYEEALDLVYSKSQDYATESDPFKNFRLGAAFAGVTLEQGILVRLGDKFARVVNLLEKKDAVGATGENITDTLRDAMNYTNILLTWRQLGEPAAGTTWAEQTELPLVDVSDPELEDYVSEIASSTGATSTKESNWFVEYIARKLDERKK